VAVGPVQRDEATGAFFDGTAARQFLLSRCSRCGKIGEPQALACPACGSGNLSPQPASGGAKVVSWTIVHSRLPEVSTKTVVIGELDEGPWWWAQLLDAPAASAMHPGMRLALEIERAADDGEWVPVFRPADTSPDNESAGTEDNAWTSHRIG
jgi:uncharacterized protein